MWAVRAVLIAILIIIVVFFAYNNFGPDQTVDVHLQPFYDNYIDVPLVTVVFWSFVAGIILSLLLFVTTYFKLSLQMRSAKKKIKALESEVAILRNRPIEESVDLLKNPGDKPGETASSFRKD